MSIKILVVALVLTFAQCGYDQNLAQTFSRLSYASHCAKLNVENWNCTICKTYPYIQHPTYFTTDPTTTDFAGFIGIDSRLDAIVLVFRGTRNRDQWGKDFKTLKVKYSLCDNCYVHQGFYEAYLEVRPTVLELVKKYHEVYQKSSIQYLINVI